MRTTPDALTAPGAGNLTASEARFSGPVAPFTSDSLFICPEVAPVNVKGIEINPHAAELAGVSVRIGEIQWMRRNGFAEARDPILKPLDTIECRDAILTADNTEPEWPTVDVVIGIRRSWAGSC